MNEAGAIALLLFATFGFLLMLIGVAFFVARLFSTVCPHCSKRITKSDDELPCPMCEHCGEPPADPPLAGASGCCRLCLVQLSPDTGIRLWDNNCYCHRCLSAECPELLARAKAGDPFFERMEQSPWTFGKGIMGFAFLVVFAMGLLMAVLFLVKGEPDNAIGSALFIPILGLPVGVLFGLSAVRSFRWLRPSFSVQNGRLIMRVGSDISDVALMDCRWFEGKASQTQVLRFGQNNGYSFLLRGPAIVIQVPVTYARPRTQITVGFTEETYRLWKSFFMLAGVPQLIPEVKRNRKLHQRIYDWWLSPA